MKSSADNPYYRKNIINKLTKYMASNCHGFPRTSNIDEKTVELRKIIKEEEIHII